VWAAFGAVGEASQLVIGGDSTNIGTIITISPKSTDTESTLGSALLNTIAGITDADADNPYLIRLGPGTYNVGSSGLVMKPWVSIEGSGEAATKIAASAGSGNRPNNVGGIVGADNTELRFLTVENTVSGSSWAAAIVNNGSSPTIMYVIAKASGLGAVGIVNVAQSSPKLIYVTAQASGTGEAYGVYNDNSSPSMTHVSLYATGADYSYGIKSELGSDAFLSHVNAEASAKKDAHGFDNLGSTAKITKSSINASGGVIGYGIITDSALTMDFSSVASTGESAYGILTSGSATMTIDHSVVEGTTYTVYNGSGFTVRIGDTQLAGGPANDGNDPSRLTCAGVYDENYVFSQTTCP
jgi:hypothetical protein